MGTWGLGCGWCMRVCKAWSPGVCSFRFAVSARSHAGAAAYHRTSITAARTLYKGKILSARLCVRATSATAQAVLGLAARGLPYCLALDSRVHVQGVADSALTPWEPDHV